MQIRNQLHIDGRGAAPDGLAEGYGVKPAIFAAAGSPKCKSPPLKPEVKA